MFLSRDEEGLRVDTSYEQVDVRLLNYPPELVPHVSIVSTIYDMKGYANLKALAASIERQQVHDLEFVIVVERERRGLQPLIQHLQNATSFPIAVIYSDQALGISKARNLGAKYSRGRIISFVDDDAQLLGTWLGELVNAFFRHPEAIGATGPSLPDWEDARDTWFPQELYWILGCSAWTGFEEERESDYAWGVNMSFKREVFSKCTFRDAFTSGAKSAGKSGPVGDDVEFSLWAKRTCGGTIVFDPKLRVAHKVPSYKTTPLFIRKYAYWQGFSDARFKRLNRAHSVRSMAEFSALKRIGLSFLPRTAKDLFRKPRVAWRRCSAMAQVLTFFCMGYGAYLFRR